MATTTTELDTELSAVNSILGAIGQSPGTTLSNYTELAAETSYTATSNQTTFALGFTYTNSTEIKVSINGTATTAFTLSGSNIVLNSGATAGQTVKVYREVVKYNTLENPETAFIYNILTEVNKDVQNEGWHFNTENHVEANPDNNKHINLPANTLRYDINNGLVSKTTDVVTRNGRLYDTVNHTDEFDSAVYVDVVTLYAFEDIPNVFQRYITYRAAVRAATQLVSNAQLVQLLQQDEAKSRASCIDYDCDKGDHSFFGIPHGSGYRPYTPFSVLSR